MKKYIALILILALGSNCGNGKKPTTSATFNDDGLGDSEFQKLEDLANSSDTNPQAPGDQQFDVASLLDQFADPLGTDAFNDSRINQLIQGWTEKLKNQEGTIKMLQFLLLVLHLAKGSKEKCYEQAIAGGKNGIMKKLKACAADDFSKTLSNPQVLLQLLSLTQKTPGDPQATQRLLDPLKDGGMNYPGGLQ